MKKKDRTLCLCTIYRELHKTIIKITALYLEQIIYRINCQQQKSFPGMIGGLDITPTIIYLLQKCPFIVILVYLSHLQHLILSNIVNTWYYPILFNVPYMSTRCFLLAWSCMSLQTYCSMCNTCLFNLIWLSTLQCFRPSPSLFHDHEW